MYSFWSTKLEYLYTGFPGCDSVLFGAAVPLMHHPAALIQMDIESGQHKCVIIEEKKLQFPCESCIMPFLFIRRECGCLETNVPLPTRRSHKRDFTVRGQAGGEKEGSWGSPRSSRCQRLMDKTSRKM